MGFLGGHGMRLKQCLCAAILLCAAAASTPGQEARKAISKPTPRYPAIAKQIGLVGTVKVEITIAPDGKDKSTNVIGGHPLPLDATLTPPKEWNSEPAKPQTVSTLTFESNPTSENVNAERQTSSTRAAARP